MALKFEVSQLVTLTEYPILFRALQYVDQVNGRINRAEDTPGHYRVPSRFNVGEIENGLRFLDPEEFQTFCDGEEEEMAAIGERSDALYHASELLDAHFEKRMIG